MSMGPHMMDLLQLFLNEAQPLSVWAMGYEIWEPTPGRVDYRDFHRSPERLLAEYWFPNDVRVINGHDAQYLVKLIERRPSYLPKLADVEAKVRAALVRRMAEAKALEQATALLKQVKDPAALAAAASAAKLAVHTTGDFSRADGTIPGIGEFHEAVQAASLLPGTPAIISRPLTLDGNAYVFEVTSRTPPTEEQWKAAKAAFKDQLLKQRQAQAWESFVQELRARGQIFVRPELVGEKGPETPM